MIFLEFAKLDRRNHGGILQRASKSEDYVTIDSGKTPLCDEKLPCGSFKEGLCSLKFLNHSNEFQSNNQTRFF